MDLRLHGRSCLVTGASRGIGRGAAKVLAAEGCRVAVVARRENLLEELSDEIEADGFEAPVIIAEDLTSAGAPERIHARIVAELGGLDILVNNAGGSRPVKWDAPLAEWHEGMTLNFELVRQLTNQFIPRMRERKWGRIINVTGANEPPGVNIASVAKAALHNWAKGLSRELARRRYHRELPATGPDQQRANPESPASDGREPQGLHRRQHPDRVLRRARGHGVSDRLPRVAVGPLHHGRGDPRRRRHAPLRGMMRYWMILRVRICHSSSRFTSVSS